MKWYKFDETKGSRQKRPPEKKFVVVLIESQIDSLPECPAVGYLKYGAGDRQSPYFVVPGYPRQENPFNVLKWCDCLKDNFNPWDKK